jgi:hypothetical protein
MTRNTTGSFFARMRQRFFRWSINREIFANLFPHLEHESDEGYPFVNDVEMVAQSEALDVQSLLEDVEKQIEKLPKAYGQCFRYLMRRDIHERLQMYARLAKRRTPPTTLDPRFVARHA